MKKVSEMTKQELENKIDELRVEIDSKQKELSYFYENLTHFQAMRKTRHILTLVDLRNTFKRALANWEWEEGRRKAHPPIGLS